MSGESQLKMMKFVLDLRNVVHPGKCKEGKTISTHMQLFDVAFYNVQKES